MSDERPQKSQWTLAAALVVLFSWGLIGHGVLDNALLYFLGVVLPLGYLIEQPGHRRRDTGRAHPWNGVWLTLSGGAAFSLGLTAHAAIGWLLF